MGVKHPLTSHDSPDYTHISSYQQLVLKPFRGCVDNNNSLLLLRKYCGWKKICNMTCASCRGSATINRISEILCREKHIDSSGSNRKYPLSRSCRLTVGNQSHVRLWQIRPASLTSLALMSSLYVSVKLFFVFKL